MSFVSKKASGKDYPYFRAGGEGQYYLGRPEKPNVQNILKSLDYVKDKSTHYFEVEDKLIAMLPEPERKEYLSKRSAELLARLRRLKTEIQRKEVEIIPLEKESYEEYIQLKNSFDTTKQTMNRLIMSISKKYNIPRDDLSKAVNEIMGKWKGR